MNKLCDFVNIPQEGQAFVQFENSLEDDQVVLGYIPVKSTLEAFDFLKDAISRNTSRSRAVICWGNYGTGKSRLCTVIARLFKEGYASNVMRPIWDRLKARGESDSLNQLKQEMMPGGSDWRPWLVVPVYGVGGGATLAASLIQSLMKSLRRVGLDESVLGKTIYQAAAIRLDDIISEDFKYIPSKTSEFQSIAQLKRALIEDYSDQALSEFSDLHKKITHGIDFHQYVHGTGGIAVTAHDVYNNVAENIQRLGYDGIIVIWDEFGFMIEQMLKGGQSGIRNLGQEAMDLQNFIEQSCGSNHLSRRIIFMGFTHVGLSEYGMREDLSQTDQNRLDTISGRFREPSIHIRLGITESEGYHLISGMINRHQQGHELFINPIVKLQKIAERMPKFRLWSNLPSQTCYDNIVAACYPIHPVATTALLLLSDQIAQQNRTTFYYLQNETEEGALAHIKKTDMPSIDDIGGPELLRIHNIFPFFNIAIKENKRRLYEQYEEAIASYPDANELEVKIMRIVLILTVIANPDLSPTTNMICFCLCDKEANEVDAHSVLEALNTLTHANALWKNDATNVWGFVGGRGVNSEIERLIDEQKDLIPTRPSAELIRRYHQVQEEIIELLGDFVLDPSDTGIVRRISIQLFDIARGMESIEEVNPAKNGSHALWRSALIYLLVVDNDTQLNLWSSQVKHCSKANIYFLIPNIPLDIISDKIRDLIAIQNVLKDTQPENHAYDVLEGRLMGLRKDLKQRFGRIFGNEGLRGGTEILKSGETPIRLQYTSWNEFLLSMPDILEEDFKHKIRVRCGTFNEWYAGSSWGAINKIVERIINYEQHPEWHKEYLGFSETSQEAAIIDGVLIENNFLYQNSLTEQWDIIDAGNACESEVLCEIRKHFQTGGNDGKAFLKLFSRLVDAPFGIPNGIIPILLALVFRTEGARIAVFSQESGRGQMKRVSPARIPETLVKMTRSPKKYFTRFEKLSGKYRIVFKAIGPELGIRENVNSLGEAFYDYCKEVRMFLKKWLSSLPEVIPSGLSENQRQLVKLLRNPVPPQLPVLAEALVNIIEEDPIAITELNSTGLDSYPNIAKFWRNLEAQIDRHVEGVKAPFRLAVRELLGTSETDAMIAQNLIELIETLHIPADEFNKFEDIIEKIGGYFSSSQDVYESIASAICNKNPESLTEEDYGIARGTVQMLKLLPKKQAQPSLVKEENGGAEKSGQLETEINADLSTQKSFEQIENQGVLSENSDSIDGNGGDSNRQKKGDSESGSQNDLLAEDESTTLLGHDGYSGETISEKNKIGEYTLILPTGKEVRLPATIHDSATNMIRTSILNWNQAFSLTKDQFASLVLKEIYSDPEGLKGPNS
jgi:hypothetical protein